MAERNYFINGITELLILSILYDHDSYVYEITKTIENNSDGLLLISQNTIYTATYKLQTDGHIKDYEKLVGKRRRRIYYQITELGISHLKELQEHYNNTTNGVQNITNQLTKHIFNNKTC